MCDCKSLDDYCWSPNHITHRLPVEKYIILPKKWKQPIVIPEEVEKEEHEPVMVAHESIYELTLTTDKDDVYALRTALSKIVKSAMYEVVYWEACIELTKAKMPHIHAIIYSKKKYCDGTKIKTMFDKRYEFKKVRNETAFLNYIIKEKNNVTTSMYCEEKGVQQIWRMENENTELGNVAGGQPFQNEPKKSGDC